MVLIHTEIFKFQVFTLIVIFQLISEKIKKNRKLPVIFCVPCLLRWPELVWQRKPKNTMQAWKMFKSGRAALRDHHCHTDRTSVHSWKFQQQSTMMSLTTWPQKWWYNVIQYIFTWILTSIKTLLWVCVLVVFLIITLLFLHFFSPNIKTSKFAIL